MKIFALHSRWIRYVPITLTSAALSACAVGTSPSFSPQLASPGSRSLIDNRLVPGTHFASPTFAIGRSRPGVSPARIERDLFVSDFSTSVVILKNKSYKKVGELQNGLSVSEGVWVDDKGNVYVANAGSNVVEYKKGRSSPACTYTGPTDPINVTTDKKGNVYVVDYNFQNNPGYIDEFAQCQNTILKQWSIDNAPTGIAVDAAGDLFVAYGLSLGLFEEFKGGSGSPTPLGATVSSQSGIVLDSKGNLIAVDQLAGSIDLIAPPYNTATPWITTGLDDPFRLSLSKKENLLFCASAAGDGPNGYVTVYSYPSGSLITTLGSGDGLDGASGVGESPDAVF